VEKKVSTPKQFKATIGQAKIKSKQDVSQTKGKKKSATLTTGNVEENSGVKETKQLQRKIGVSESLKLTESRKQTAKVVGETATQATEKKATSKVFAAPATEKKAAYKVHISTAQATEKQATLVFGTFTTQDTEKQATSNAFAAEQNLDLSTVELITSSNTGPICIDASAGNSQVDHTEEIINFGSFETDRYENGDTGKLVDASELAPHSPIGTGAPENHEDQPEGETEEEIQYMIGSVEEAVHFAQSKYLECLTDAVNDQDFKQFITNTCATGKPLPEKSKFSMGAETIGNKETIHEPPESTVKSSR
jgi:hypothetical protein